MPELLTQPWPIVLVHSGDTLGLKDLRLASEAAAAAGRSLPMLNAVHGRMKETVDAGFGDRDWSAIAAVTIEG